MVHWFEVILGVISLALLGLIVYSSLFFAFIEFVMMMIMLMIFVFGVAFNKRFLLLIFFLLSLLNLFYLFFSDVRNNIIIAAIIIALLGVLIVISGYKPRKKAYSIRINKKSELAKQLGSIQREEPKVEIIKKRTRKK